MTTRISPNLYDPIAWSLVQRFYQAEVPFAREWLPQVRVVLDHPFWPPRGNQAMVWGTKVYIARKLLSTPYTWWDRALNLAAECAHVEQFQRWGKLGVARRWLWQVVMNPMAKARGL